MLKTIFSLIILIFFMACSFTPTLPAVGAKLSNNKLLKKSYDSYTIFFSAQKIDLTNEEKNKQKYLQKAFNSFGKSIGDNNIAIWTGKSYRKFDIDVSKDLCDLYSLSYSNGPYIVFSRNNPITSKQKLNNDVILDFSSVNASRIKYVLNEIEQKIRLHTYDNVNYSQMNKQIVYSFFENQEEFIKEAILAILGS